MQILQQIHIIDQAEAVPVGMAEADQVIEVVHTITMEFPEEQADQVMFIHPQMKRIILQEKH